MVMNCYFCETDSMDKLHQYDAPPPGETLFPMSTPYSRGLYRCSNCRHMQSEVLMPQGVYEGEYIRRTYGNIAGVCAAFGKVMVLPHQKSDNAGRCLRIDQFFNPGMIDNWMQGATLVLDVGSGLCVFLAKMKQMGWTCTANDPDEMCTRFAEELGIRAYRGTYQERCLQMGRHDLVTFNHVLEHVENPIDLLFSAGQSSLFSRGVAYIEVPDGDAAYEDGPNREEFMNGHGHVFSRRSLEILIRKSGMAVAELERVREPSGKYVLWAFAKPR